MEEKTPVLITSYEGSEFRKVLGMIPEKEFLKVKDDIEKLLVIGYSPILEKWVESKAWFIGGHAVHSIKYASENIYHCE